MTFEGKCVLVNGAAGGVGRATTAAFRAKGAWQGLACPDKRFAIEDWRPRPMTFSGFSESMPHSVMTRLRQSLQITYSALC